jgi:hypothetical protein
LLLPQRSEGVDNYTGKYLNTDDVDKNIVKLIKEELAPVVFFWILRKMTVKPAPNSPIVLKSVIKSCEKAN